MEDEMKKLTIKEKEERLYWHALRRGWPWIVMTEKQIEVAYRAVFGSAK
jgi:hypothetical protein